jgi:VanZ family protein
MLLMAYVFAAVLVATLAPFRFAWPQSFALDLEVRRSDLLLNLLLLFPLGFLYRLSGGGRGRPGCMDAFLLGATLSVGIELVQLFLPTRCASPVDMLANATGAWAGAHVHRVLGPVSDRRLIGRLRRQLPLSHVLYLALPALWLDALAARHVERLLTTLPLGLFGAAVAVAVWQNGAGERSTSTRRLVLTVASWFALGIAPAFVREPLVAAMLVCVVAVGADVMARTGLLRAGVDRRFELPTLRRAGPLLLAYLACLSVQGAGFADMGFVFRLGFPTFGAGALTLMLTVMESLAAFTLLGYVLAELGSRGPRAARAEYWRIGITAALFAVGTELSRALLSNGAGSATTAMILVMAALWGAALYRAQLSLALRQRRGAQVAPAEQRDLAAAA